MQKKVRLIVGIFVLVIVCIVGYYQYVLSKYKGIQEVVCYQVKKDVAILPGDSIDINTNVTPVMADKNKIPSDYIKSQSDLKDMVSNVPMYPGDVITTKKIVKKSEYYNDIERYVCLNSKDINSFAGNDVRPGDVIDILIYDPDNQDYIAKADYQDIHVLDVKNTDSIGYREYKGNDFKVQSIYFKMTNDLYSKLMTDINKNNSKFVVSIHGNRSVILKDKSSSTNSATTTLDILK